MSNNHYDTPESIFSIPGDVTAVQRMDLIEHTLSRMIGTIQTVAAAVGGSEEMPDAAIPDCLYGVCGQLEQLEKLIKFEVKEEK